MDDQKEVLKDGQIELKVHGLKHVNQEEVPASVFANKLRQLVKALHAADEAANGKQLHQYTIARLHTSSPTAILNERPNPKLYVDRSASALPIFVNGVDAIKTDTSPARAMPEFVSAIRRMTSGADKSFAFAEVRTKSAPVIRIDEFLRERSVSIEERVTSKGVPDGGWYRGAVVGSFDGKLEYVDLRGALPQIKLTLSAGGKQIDCICRHEDIQSLGDALAHRVRVFGRAIYDGKSGLPRRVEVTEIKPVKENADFERWRGAFRTFEPESWYGDDA